MFYFRTGPRSLVFVTLWRSQEEVNVAAGMKEVLGESLRSILKGAAWCGTGFVSVTQQTKKIVSNFEHAKIIPHPSQNYGLQTLNRVQVSTRLKFR